MIIWKAKEASVHPLDTQAVEGALTPSCRIRRV